MLVLDVSPALLECPTLRYFALRRSAVRRPREAGLHELRVAGVTGQMPGSVQIALDGHDLVPPAKGTVGALREHRAAEAD